MKKEEKEKEKNVICKTNMNEKKEKGKRGEKKEEKNIFK